MQDVALQRGETKNMGGRIDVPPAVSIGMPVYNDVQFLEKALRSLLNQTFTDFEFIISDDCSTDGSETVCRRYAEMDSRIKYIRQQKNIGISKNMEVLLSKAKGKYFMWAGNDDIWDPAFIETLVKGFEDEDILSVFCPMYFIDEDDKVIAEHGIIATDYSAPTPYQRLKKLVKRFDDAFGYGLFIREKIISVKFPVWWWINKRCAYNNIYPTLCYYLAKGNFKLVESKPLWLNRLKNEKNINHKVPYNRTFLRGVFAFTLRKFNLVFISLKNICRTRNGFILMIKISPIMFYRWMLIPSFSEFKIRLDAWRKKTISFW